jgi:50S ribosomal protein L16 3-hydroxylase
MGEHLAHIRWDERTVAHFLGCFLTEPKPTVFFEPPAAPLTGSAFGRRIASRGIVLDLRTQLLYDDASLYINGDALARPAGAEACERLANERALAADRCARATRDVASLLYQWYRNGYLHPAG